MCCTCSRCAKPSLRARTEPGRLNESLKCRHAAGVNDLNLEPRAETDFLSFAAPRHPCPSSTLSPSDPHARSVCAALAALKSEGYKLKDLTGFPRRIYAAPSGINPLLRSRVDWDLA